MAFYYLNPQFFYKSAAQPFANFYQYNITGRKINGSVTPLVANAIAPPPNADYCVFTSDQQSAAILITGNALSSEAYFGNDWVYDGDTGTALNLGVDVARLNATNAAQPVPANFFQANLSNYDGIQVALRYDPDKGNTDAPNSIIVNLGINTDIICNNKYYQSHDHILNAGDRVIVTLDFSDCEEADPTGPCNQMCGLPAGSVAATNLDRIGNIGIRIKQNPLSPYLLTPNASFSVQGSTPIRSTPLGSTTGQGVLTLSLASVSLNPTDTVIIGVYAVGDTLVSMQWNGHDATADKTISFASGADNAAIYSYRNVGGAATGSVTVTTTGSGTNRVLLTATKVVGLLGNNVYWKGQQPTLVLGNSATSAKNESWSVIHDEPDSGFSVPTMTTSLFAAGLVMTNYFNGVSQPSVNFGFWNNGFTLDQQATVNKATTNAYGLSQAHYITDTLNHFKAEKSGNFNADSDYWGALISLYA